MELNKEIHKIVLESMDLAQQEQWSTADKHTRAVYDTFRIQNIVENLTIPVVSRSTKVDKTKHSVKCLHCGRSFIKKLPHKCNTGFRKRNHKWLELTDD